MSVPDGPRIGATHAALLAGGAGIGLGLAALLVRLPFDFSSELERARALGIVSLTILAGYPKSLDLWTYAAALGLPVAGALGAWTGWGRRHRACLERTMPALDDAGLPKRWGWWVGVALFVLLSSYEASFFRQPGYNDVVGSWVFLGEEGENLAWVHSLRNGGVYGRDFFCLYGPMLLYPLAWVMDLAGESVTVARAYKYGMDLAAYAIIVAWLHGVVRRPVVFVAASVLFVLVFPSRTYAGINGTYLRVALGLLPLLCLVVDARRRQRGTASSRPWLPLLAGAAAGQSLLFSQEVGLCSLLASGAITLAASGRRWRALASATAAFALGCALSLLPMVAYLIANDAGAALLDSLYGYPRLVTLGYGALPFPSLGDFLTLAPHSVLPYAIVGVYAFTAIRLATRAVVRGLGWRELAELGLLVFGALLFRAALGRSDETNFFRVWPPAVLLVFCFADEAISELRCRARPRAPAAVLLVAVVLWGTAIFIATPYARAQAAVGIESSWDLVGKWQDRSGGIEMPSIERGGVRYDPATATAIRDIRFFLERYAQPEEPVYFFPNEAAYYFLFDRPNPTRYAIAYFAVTAEQRRELVAALERERPRFVVYSRDTWRVDDIPEDVQVPEVVEYLDTRYRTVATLGGVEFRMRAR